LDREIPHRTLYPTALGTRSHVIVALRSSASRRAERPCGTAGRAPAPLPKTRKRFPGSAARSCIDSRCRWGSRTCAVAAFARRRASYAKKQYPRVAAHLFSTKSH
jgi:hypothetical protein